MNDWNENYFQFIKVHLKKNRTKIIFYSHLKLIKANINYQIREKTTNVTAKKTEKGKYLHQCRKVSSSVSGEEVLQPSQADMMFL